jgi:putative endonuclease
VPGKPLGDRGEELAAHFLAQTGWSILHRNYRVGRNEIDLVARRDGVVAFVEVKTRRGLGCGHPLESITPRKQRQIARVASVWIGTHGAPGDSYRFDAVAILLTPGSPPLIEHMGDAWGY